MQLWLQKHGLHALGVVGVSFALSLVLTVLVMKVTRARGLVARPSADRWHSQPTALFGGVGIFLTAALCSLLFLPIGKYFWSFGVAVLFIFLLGLVDDLKALPPAHKFIAQLVAACYFVAQFYAQEGLPTHVWLVPFAILWIVGITNAFNLLDNMDGLSSGVAVIVSLLMAMHAMAQQNSVVALGALVLAGAAGGFLYFNFNPARIFMGDCGSMFLGFSLACLTLMGQSELLASNLFTALLLPTLALATPIFDTSFVSIVRFLNGRPISRGGRDHTSHRLVMLGLSERRAVMWLYIITTWFGLLALWGSTARNPLLTIAITVVSAIALVVLGIFLAEVQTYSEEEYENARRNIGDKTVLSRVFMHKRHFVEALMDFSLVCACWILAFILRFDGQIGVHTRELGITLPYVAAAQMVSFYVCGQYRGLWRYLTVSDVSHAFSGVVMGTLSAGMLIWAFEPSGRFSFSVLAIYAALLLLTVIGIRASLKALRFHFAVQWSGDHKRAIVVGAGDAGELAVREMLHNKNLNLQPVGFLDDDPSKQRARIHGIRVLGTRDELLKFVDKLNVDEVIIAMPSIGNGAVQEIVEMCQQNGITHREVRGVIL